MSLAFFGSIPNDIEPKKMRIVMDELKKVLEFLSAIDANRLVSVSVLFAYLLKRYVINGTVKTMMAYKEREISILVGIEERIEEILKMRQKEHP